jgi:hypothetical protein
MSNSSGIETPRTKIATAQATFGLAVRINAEVVAGRLRTTIYQREVVIHTGGTGLLLPPDYRAGKQDLLDGTQNLVVMALGASALTLDDTLDEVFGKPEADPEAGRRGLRVMVNQLRNAFAHNPWRPRWVIWPKYRAVHTITLGATGLPAFDATNLDGAGVKPEDVGGLESWVKVLQYCEGIVPA